MPLYEVTINVSRADRDNPDRLSVLVEGNSALHVKALVEERYGEGGFLSAIRVAAQDPSVEPDKGRALGASA